jgi:predicted RND superfamily exporter protein
MKTLSACYDGLILKRPGISLLLIALLVAFFAFHATKFKLDASPDSLILENDEALSYYRSIRARYGSDDSLIITYTPGSDLFSEPVLADLQQLRDNLAGLDRVESVVSLLDVPLISSPPVSLTELSKGIQTLRDPKTDIDLARKELVTSPLYRNLVISPDSRTTALQVNFRRDDKYHQLLDQRNRLRELRLKDHLSTEGAAELESASSQFNAYRAGLLDQQSRDIAAIRNILDKHREHAKLYLGGVPMIVADSIDFIRHDLLTFGIGVFFFLVIILAVVFSKPRWILLPMMTCTATGLIMIGFLGLVDWPVTVVSSNFISLMLILTLSLTIHLIVRYRELHARNPGYSQYKLVRETIRAKAMPCFYTATTTIVAFGSLLFSSIRPVIDFGWMMAIGTGVAFILSFTLFPATLMLLKPGQPPVSRNITAAITRFLAHFNERYQLAILTAFVVIVILSIQGISMLTVENRFIDYFKDSTEIYQGMELIDRQLGGTTPLDVIIDAPDSFFLPDEEPDAGESETETMDDEIFMDDSDLDDASSAGITGSSYWFNTYRMETVEAIHNYLDGLPETGKVMSITSVLRMLKQLEEGRPLDNFFLSIIYKRIPDEIRSSLFTPFMSEDGNQLRFSIRVFESDPSLRREVLLQKIRSHLTNDMQLEDEQVHLSGMLVLYNNMLQSLFRSQIMTLGVVFLAILLMFVLLFHNLKLALIAIVPNLVASIQVLGVMGWLNIPLDIMTITIAAIVIGIAVDDAIHYVYRFKSEFQKDGNYWKTMERCHDSIGRAMYYTTITVTLGFMILALSNFIPTIYFGLLTGVAMLVALLANLTLLPLLIIRLKPLGQAK